MLQKVRDNYSSDYRIQYHQYIHKPSIQIDLGMVCHAPSLNKQEKMPLAQTHPIYGQAKPSQSSCRETQYLTTVAS